jgi:subtilisin family serine protease
VSRSTPSRRPARRRVQSAAFGLLVLGLFAAPARAQEACGPFEPSSEPGIGACREPGLSSTPGAPDAFTRVQASPDDAGAISVPGEALLALPKQPDGSIPTDFVLAPGAKVAGSFFSPILCATIARVTGPGGGPDALFESLPDGAIAVPHHVYRTAGANVRLLGAPGPGTGPDPYRPLQYALDQLGVDRERGVGSGAGVRVAVLDSAPDTGHPDLAGLKVRAVEGGPPTTPAIHGTLVSGVIRAVEGNAFGIAGVAPASDTVAIAICSAGAAGASDRCGLYDALKGLDAVWEMGAAVANLSIVGPPNALLERSVNRLESLGVLIVAAAGNEGTREPRYPAAYASVIGVSAIDRLGRPFVRANRGPSAELDAPGVEILSTHPGATFAFVDGTSLSAAHVSGLLALLLSNGVEPLAARSALFGAAVPDPGNPGTARLAPVCDALARAGRPCVAP